MEIEKFRKERRRDRVTENLAALVIERECRGRFPLGVEAKCALRGADDSFHVFHACRRRCVRHEGHVELIVS